ncbi:MAG: phosphoglycerate kinase [Candidatus Andersenbacteria bacterium CG10_big_fil_rev_8_21_14_0_10_54_11]|uniref:Phosphoglycerate kinase n=1 Tax=Candidatus Andersenbacteria bacterium CG10_big_fil_rev_8_21_14_0_10_54_11 TaxID=1974485 RepID=A0A2M6WZT1_9BACT|nr:MAG: phosphoglycerate kinase [Candidatus Andersenbacteria bacterium CG10_big_fil_rev_8_21_14_0_10_54_11]
MRCIRDVSSSELRGKRVLLRASLDLPVGSSGAVTDAFRLTQAMPTIRYLVEHGARTVVIAKIGRDTNDSLSPVAEAMKKYVPVFFVRDILGHAAVAATRAMRDGEIVLLENLQQDAREVAGAEGFAEALAAFGDIYVNDCFPSAHRASASMVKIPLFLPSYAGLQLYEEVTRLTEALRPSSPSFAIIGGAKFETKDPIIRSFLDRYDRVAVVGAIANDVLKAKGLPVGRSKVSEYLPPKEIVESPKLLAPLDVVCETSDTQAYTKKVEDVGADDKIVDIGPETVARMADDIQSARFILWNGPTGLYEEGYADWTIALAELIAQTDAQKVIGGGDTIAVLQGSGVPLERLGFLSTGGGAMLEFLLKGTLPGIEALR